MSIAGGKILDGFLSFQGQTVGAPQDPKPLTSSSGMNRFADAMHRADAPHVPPIAPPQGPQAVQLTQAVQPPVRVAANQPATQTDASPSATVDPGASERARRTLQLDKPEAPSKPAETGDRILDGLQKLRGVFDQQQGKINAMIKEPVGDASKLMALQVEVVNYSVLVDVSSKLTGKSTQALETLLKGQ